MRKILITVGEIEFTASLLDEEAPRTAKAFWSILPIETTLHHAKIAGNEVFSVIYTGEPFPHELENRATIGTAKPGSIWMSSDTTLGMIYGETSNEPFPINVLAKVTEESELAKMKKACRSVWRKNGQKFVVKRKI